MASSNIGDFSAQDVARCNICGSGYVKLYCNLCSSELCEQCSTKHILSDPHKRHEVIAFINKNVDPRPTGPNKYLKKPPIGGAEQEADSLSTALQEKLDLLSKDAEKIRSQTIPEMLRLEEILETQITEVHEAYKARFRDIVSQSQMLHDVINHIEEEYKTKLDQMRKQDLRELEGQKMKFGSLISEAKQQLEQYDTSDTHQKETFQFPLLAFPQPVQWTAPAFVPIQPDMEFVRPLFGTLTESKVQAHPERPRPPTSTSSRESGFTMRRYRPNICKCENPRVKKSAITGEKKCVKCNDFIK